MWFDLVDVGDVTRLREEQLKLIRVVDYLDF